MVLVMNRFAKILVLSALLFMCAVPKSLMAEEAPRAVLSDKESKQLLEQSNKSFWEGRYSEARKILLKVLAFAKEAGKSQKNWPRLLINLGIVHLVLQQPEEAGKFFDDAESLLKEQFKDQELNYADCLVGKAEATYQQGHPEDAIELYQKALTIYEKKFSAYSPDLLPALEGLGGSYYATKEYEKALPYFKKIAQIDLIKYGAQNERVGKSFSNLSDVYYKLERCDGARPFFSQSVWIFRKNNRDRILKDYQSAEAKKKYSQVELETIRKRITDIVLGVQDPIEFRRKSFQLLEDNNFSETCPICEYERPKDFTNWKLKRDLTGNPGEIFIDPTKEVKGIIVCLHGLGLNHASYKEFADKITRYGYCVIAIDVRGFGSLSHEKGFDKVDLQAGLEDLTALVSTVRFNNRKLPIFVLGESMGGALALQFTAQNPELVDGLISSVPSGRRFKSKRTKILVGIKLLNDPQKPFSIGERVIDQATDNKSVKKQWLNDPANRLKLSAKELVDFESFMKHNEKYARKIKKTPVVVFQGFKDHLVRPTGTYMLYQALNTSDKDLIFLGDKEHLVFEEGQATDEIVSMLVAWLDSHLDIIGCEFKEEDKVSEKK